MSFLPSQVPYHSRQNKGGLLAVLLWILASLGVVAALVYGWHYLETEPADGQGIINLKDILIVREAERLELQANAQIKLSSTIQAGLDSGVPLTFVLNLSVKDPLVWLPDRTVVDLQRHYKLTYYELTRHYRVHAVETDVSRNFRSLSSALTGLGQLGRITFELNQGQVQQIENSELVGSLDMRLSKSALPLPLQPIIRSSWTLVSEEYRWPVT
ncbi:MAG: DUF4390 domain-containing protein [Granulosicoccus sp.]